MIQYICTEKDRKNNIRQYLLSFHISSSIVYKLLSEKRVYINGKVCSNNEQMLKEGDKVEILEDNNDVIPYNKEIDIIYEDDYLLAVYKHPSVLIHPDSPNNQITLANMVSNYYKRNKLDIPVRYAHRIDKETCGVVLFTKGIMATSYLNYQFQENIVEKKYLAICHGTFEKKSGVIDKNIGKDRHNNNHYIVCKTGKKALTKYNVLDSYNNLSKLEVTIETGRTHQIRVHLSSINHPIVSDKIYYKDEGIDMKLQSYSLKFYHPLTKEIFMIKLDDERRLHLCKN